MTRDTEEIVIRKAIEAKPDISLGEYRILRDRVESKPLYADTVRQMINEIF